MMKRKSNLEWAGCFLRAHFDTATKMQERPKGTDREPSSARSASDRGTGVELA